jgi:hypothetical protein
MSLAVEQARRTDYKSGRRITANCTKSMENRTFIDLVGNTPLVYLRRASKETGCTILGKAEFLNPGQSVKDRAALWIVRDAEARGLLRPGGTIVEGTAGNTGIGLALVGNNSKRRPHNFSNRVSSILLNHHRNHRRNQHPLVVQTL